MGSTRKVYAVDIHPLAIKQIRKKAEIKGIKNLYTIFTDCETKLPGSSIDIVLLFYALHECKDPDSIIREIERILKANGILAIIDHKFDNTKVVSTIRHATSALKRDAGERNVKSKEELLIFSKQEF